MKENDIILNMLANPEFTVDDFLSVGLTGNNTGLRDEKEYINSDKIKNIPEFQTNGEFDEAKFHNFYIGAGLMYNQLATQNYDETALDEAQYSKDNIWVSPEKRTIDYSPKLVRQENEHLVTSSLERLGKRGQRELSQSEIAQTQPLYNTETGEWTESPNESFFDNFFETLVLATYDEDEFDENGKLIHQKGERKLNEDGLPYYETLGGRNVYGKQVLNKLNMLTVDGSDWNKYDFFDSDDLEQKSVGGTILRNAALVGSMFIPGNVGAWIAGISVAMQTAGLLATLAKLKVGDDSEFLNNVQGWAKSVNRSAQTEYAAQNTWCVENFINLIGDTVGQLAEQRWIFKYAPSILGHTQATKAMSSEEGYKKVLKEVQEELASSGTNTKNLLNTLREQGYKGVDLFELSQINKALAATNAKNAALKVDDLIEKANIAGAPISRAYMTALVIQDTYGEAKAAGASDLEAALLTLGYAGAEYRLLKSNIGSWIIPEASAKKFKHEAMAKALSEDVKKAYGVLAQDSSKKGFAKKLLGIGEKIAESNYAAMVGKKTLSTIGMHGVAESVEEVSEELLADVAKSFLNVSRWLQGEDALNMGQWQNMFDRYAMSAMGGFFGGGIASAGTTFNQMRSLASMDKTKAMHELLYMVNNNKEGEFLESLNKISLGNKNLSAKKIIEHTSEGNIYAEGTAEDNQDLEIKNAIRGKINAIRDILTSEGAKISEQTLLNKLTLDDQKDVINQIRFTNLQNSRVMGMYLQDFADIQSKIVSKTAEIMDIQAQLPDSRENTSVQEQRISALEAELKLLRLQKDSYLNGQMAPDAIRDALYETNPLLSGTFTKTNVKLFAKAKLGKKWEELSEQEIKDITEEYKNRSNTSMKNDIHTGATMFYDMIELFTPYVESAQEFIENLKKQGRVYNGVFKLVNDFFAARGETDDYLIKAQTALTQLNDAAATELGIPYFSQEFIQQLEEIQNSALDENIKNDLYLNTFYYGLYQTLESNIKNFTKLGYIHPEIKNALKGIIQQTEEHLTSFVLNMDVTNPTTLAYQIENDPNISFDQKDAVLQSEVEKYVEQLENLKEYNKQLDTLSNTPVIEYLKQFQLSATNSDLNILKHLEVVTDLLNDAAKNDSLDEVLLNTQWQEDNEEAMLLLDSFISVINGVKIDNADITNPTGFSKILNNIYTKRGVKDFVKLAELDTESANLILQDALLIRNKLEFIQNIYNINKNQKLRKQEDVQVNKNYLFYNTIKDRLINAIPDDWIAQGRNAKEYLLEVVNGVEEIKKVTADNFKLSKEQRAAINKEIVKINNTIYDIFQENHSQEKLELLIKNFAGVQGYFQKTGKVLNEDTKFLEDNAFIWQLASIAAVRESDFYKAYSEALTDEIAAIPGQELAVQLGVAAITNMDFLNAFIDAYRNSMIDIFNNQTPEEKRKLLKQFHEGSESFATELLEYFSSYDAVPQFHNMIFIEGIPGTGKTQGVFSTIEKVITKLDPEYLKGSILVHTTEDNAKDANKKIGLKDAVFYDKEKLMRYISPEWENVLKNPKNEGEKIYLYDDSYEFVDGKLQNKWKINTYTKPPKVIFIDEISHYNQQELSMIEQFAKQNGTVVITAGDLDQDKLTTWVNLKGKEVNVSMHRNNFMRTFKLGSSLRTLNKQMTHDIMTMQANMSLAEDGGNVDLKFTYLENDPKHKGLFGVKTTSILDENTKNTIKMMVETSTEPIGYIYHKEDSELYKYLMDNYKDKIIPYKGIEAQGREGQYYIIENDISKSGEVSKDRSMQYLRSLYTGVSRAEQGALAFVPSSQFGLVQSVSSVVDPNYQLEELSKPAIERSSKNRKEELAQLDFNERPISIKPPTPETTIPKPKPIGLPIPPKPPVSTPKDEVDAFNNKLNKLTIPVAIRKSDGSKVYIGPAIVIDDQAIIEVEGELMPLEKFLEDFNLQNDIIFEIGEKLSLKDADVIVIDVDDLIYTIADLDGSNPRKIEVDDLLDQFVDYYKEPKSEELPSPDLSPDEYAAAVTEDNETTIENVVTSKLPMKLYTFNAFEVGFNETKINDPSYRENIGFDSRIDNGIGLLHAWGITDVNSVVYKQIETTLGNFKKLLYHETDNSKILEIFKAVGIKGDQLVWAIKSTSEQLDEGYEQYYQDSELKHIYSKSENSKKPPKHKLVLLVKNGNETTFELTVASFMAPETQVQMTDSDGKPIFPNIHNAFFNEYNKSGDLYSAINYVIENLDGKLDPFEQDLINMFKLYQFTSNGIFYIGETKAGKFIPSNFNLATEYSSGPILVKQRGKHQLNRGLNYSGDFVSLEEFSKNPQFAVSSILSSKEQIGVIKPGYPFVLISTNPNITDDNTLVEEYVNGNEDVKMYYVLPPRASVSEWLQNQHHNYEEITRSGGTKKVQSLIGNEFTAYRIIQKLIENGKFDSFVGIDSIKENILEAINDLNAIENKWKEDTIKFSGNILEGTKTDQEIFEETLKLYKDEAIARNILTKKEQSQYLRTTNNWGKVPVTSDVTIKDALSAYLRNIVWKKDVTGNITEDLAQLAALDEAVGDYDIMYKTFIGSDIGPHNEFTRVITNTKFGIKTYDGKIKNFEINAKIDPPLFESLFITDAIRKIVSSRSLWNDTTSNNNTHRTNYFYYNKTKRVWVLTDKAKKFEDDYLNKSSMTKPSVKELILSKYNKYFEEGLLNESIINESLSELENLKNLMDEYIRTTKQLAVIHKGVLYLTKNKDLRLDNEQNGIYKDQSCSIVNTTRLTDVRGNVTEIRQQIAVYKTQSPKSFSGVSEKQFDDLKSTISEVNYKTRIPSQKVCKYLEHINSLSELIAFAEQARLALMENPISAQVGEITISPVTIEANINKLRNLGKDTKVLETLLNYLKSDGNVEINQYAIVKHRNGTRYLIVGENQVQKLSENEFPTEPIEGRSIEIIFFDDLKDAKIEEILCDPVIWEII